MQISATDQAFWLSSFLGQVALACVLIKRREYQRFPVFVAWIMVLIILDPLLYWCSTHFSPYSYYSAYTVTGVLDSSLQICVLLEIAHTVLHPERSRMSRRLIGILATGVCVCLLLAFIWTVEQNPLDHRLLTAYTRLQNVIFAVAFLRLVLFALIAGFSQMLGITWRNHVIRLAAGLAFYSAISLVVQLTISHMSQRDAMIYTRDYWLLNHTQVIAYLGSLTFWVWSFVQKDAPRREFTPQMQKILVTISQAARRDRVSLTRSMGHK
jgi:hypothetical protein